ncbi:sigma 54-interacting transcriptional regulator [Heyndrickxia vini]|uniref:Sigma 54-interacting transcriptional regulator n=1 Tax=Heyndrickxia vini TaxID=1476025 RepID=A0ABX7E5K5_9BACI|nr:sigma 54-interacting transcriptional regulator [Heyndrickxia vini]QQZ10525.1 sigma 54-interacting transcriptional regulator [Heyndrickxia vini]
MQLKNEIAIYKTILDLIDVGVHVIDENGKTILYNKKMIEIEGTDIEDILDKNILDVFQFYQGEDSTLLKVLHTKKPILNIQQMYFNNKGQEIKTVNNTFPIFNENTIVGAVEIVRDVTKLERMMNKNTLRETSSAHTHTFENLSDLFPQKVIETGKQMASNSSTILIIGESGTGQQILSECIHHEIYQAEKPIIFQNCSSLPESTIEQVLIDSMKLLENEKGGTLVIEDIYYLPSTSQLHFLNMITAERPYKIICTLGKDPIDLIGSGKLNKTLYYHLSELTIFIPPIRDRIDTLPSIIAFFLNKYNERFQLNVKKVSDECLESFSDYNWPGNIKEFEHVIKSSMKMLDNEDLLQYHHLPTYFRHRISHEHQFLIQKNPIKPFDEYIQEAEKYYIQKGLQYHGFNITKTAQALHMSRQNLQYRIRKYGIEKP